MSLLGQLDFIGAAIGTSAKLGAQALTSSAQENALETQDQGALAAQLAQERQALAREQLALETTGLQADTAAARGASTLTTIGGIATSMRDLAILALVGVLAFGLARVWRKR